VDISKTTSGNSPNLAVSIEIVACIIVAVLLTAAADVLLLRLIDWLAGLDVGAAFGILRPLST
jgi:hypothetical protein